MLNAPMKPMYSGNRKKLVVVIYAVEFILSIQLFQRGYVQNGGQGINEEIWPLGTSMGPPTTVSGGDNR